MKNKKLGIALLALTVFTTVNMQAKNNSNNDNQHDVGSSLLFLPTVAVDMGADAVTLDQTHQTRKYLDSRDSKNNSSSKKTSSSASKSSTTKKAKSEDAQ